MFVMWQTDTETNPEANNINQLNIIFGCFTVSDQRHFGGLKLHFVQLEQLEEQFTLWP